MSCEGKQPLTFEQRQRSELHLGALVAELGRAVGPPLPGSAHGPAREAVHLLRGRHREAGGRRGRAGRRQLGRLHDGLGWRCRWMRACVRAYVPFCACEFVKRRLRGRVNGGRGWSGGWLSESQMDQRLIRMNWRFGVVEEEERKERGDG